MLVGNDFLSHCPHLEIDNGALSLMLNNYIDLLPEWGGYLTDKEKIHPERFEQFLYHLAAFEEEHFKRRGYEENEPGWQLSSDNEQEEDDFYGVSNSSKFVFLQLCPFKISSYLILAISRNIMGECLLQMPPSLPIEKLTRK
jgi:5'-3' exonuclease